MSFNTESVFYPVSDQLTQGVLTMKRMLIAALVVAILVPAAVLAAAECVGVAAAAGRRHDSV